MLNWAIQYTNACQTMMIISNIMDIFGGGMVMNIVDKIGHYSQKIFFTIIFFKVKQYLIFLQIQWQFNMTKTNYGQHIMNSA